MVGYASLTHATKWGVGLIAPIAQIRKSLFGSFSSEKELLA
jgi:hypothetical protein